MNIDIIYDKVTAKLYQFNPKKFSFICLILILLGFIGFFTSLFGSNPERAWMAYLINVIYFMGIAQAGIMFSVILTLTNAKWGRPFKRLAEGFGFFLPFSLLFIIILIIGAEYLYPWINHPIQAKAMWLNKTFFFTRNIIEFIILFGLSGVYVYYSIRPDAGYLINEKGFKAKGFLGFFSKKWINLKSEVEKSVKMSKVLSPIIAILYSLIFTFTGIDFIMSLDPSWVSTLFGAYIFMTAIFQTLAALAIVSVLIRKPFNLEDIITKKHFHDLGTLTFAFTMVSLDFFYSQFLVIWYGNLPEETHYIILRTAQTPWQSIAYMVLAVAFAIPFIGLISKKLKQTPKAFFIIALIILIGMWFERFILIAPAVWHSNILPLGWPELSITAGFLGLFCYGYLFFLRNIPVLPLTDPLLIKKEESHS